MARARVILDEQKRCCGIWFDCPGCEMAHMIAVKDPPAGVANSTTTGPRWEFNGDLDSPTFSPSILTHNPHKSRKRRCHSFIRDGRIQFLSDCTHALAGQTVDLPVLEESP